MYHVKNVICVINFKNVICVINHVVFRAFFLFIDVIINGSFFSGFVFFLLLLRCLQFVDSGINMVVLTIAKSLNVMLSFGRVMFDS